MLLETELVRRVDNYRYKHQIPTRVEAVTVLLTSSLNAEQTEIKRQATRR